MNHTGSNPQNNINANVVAIIPARFASTRLPGKPLIQISGKPMICWVAERAHAAKNVSRVIVATDSREIFNAVHERGFEVVMTEANHKSGTDRIAEVARTLSDVDIIVNVQGDEPLIAPETIERAVEQMKHELTLEDGAGIVTAWEPFAASADVVNPDIVKILVNSDGRAIYFSRLPVPYPRAAVAHYGSLEDALEREATLLDHYRKHTGLYVYRRDVLLRFTEWSPSPLEMIESLEQLRALENGIKIKAIEASKASTGVDTADDLERVRALIGEGGFEAASLVYEK